MSLNHTLGDGHTFFQLLAMLSEPLRPLDASRRRGFADQVAEHVGREHFNWPRGGNEGFSMVYKYNFRGVFVGF